MRPWRMPPMRRRDAGPTRRPYVRVPKKKTSPEVLGGTGLDETSATAGEDDQIIARQDRRLLLTVGAAWLLFAPDWGYVWDCLAG